MEELDLQLCLQCLCFSADTRISPPQASTLPVIANKWQESVTLICSWPFRTAVGLNGIELNVTTGETEIRNGSNPHSSSFNRWWLSPAQEAGCPCDFLWTLKWDGVGGVLVHAWASGIFSYFSHCAYSFLEICPAISEYKFMLHCWRVRAQTEQSKDTPHEGHPVSRARSASLSWW
jgi:hypothetical protein